MEILEDSLVCGIDEAGRGSLAGSMFMCGVVLGEDFPQELRGELKDSKKLTQNKRDALAPLIKKYAIYHLVERSADLIDAKGLSYSIKSALEEILENISAKVYVFDGNSTFGVKNLQALIKGDDKIKAISAASILAKNAKDMQMQKLDEIYPQYQFAKNKGYGSKAHIEAILEYGMCEVHRKTYKIKSLLQPSFEF
ncbi:ribonuclease HII [Helicobacter burdigaliensis]|uniref:ribonuclease HII n=1 Tax=Helicobacter burdigaliensis TaxID=2315334 RepID=UPI000EF74C83|nr:ribonuclease HII [Helicobacter burdigaliensis]